MFESKNEYLFLLYSCVEVVKLNNQWKLRFKTWHMKRCFCMAENTLWCTLKQIQTGKWHEKGT